MMKKYILILIILLTQLPLLKAQPSPGNEDKQQRIEALYVAFVTRQLDLTADEAQQFWPIHTKFLKEIKTVKPDMPELDKQQMVLDIKKRYQNDFSKVIGNKRTEEFFKINAEFKKKLLEKIRNQKGNSRMRRGM
jgi:hypothetical protein